MNDTWFNAKKIISLILFIAVFSLMGLATGKPVMILAYAAFFLAVSGMFYNMSKKRQRHSEVSEIINPKVKQAIGGILLLLAIVLPILLVTRTNLVNLPVLNIGVSALIILITILFIGLALFAAHLINVKGKDVLGYLILIAISALPGIIMAGIDRTTTGIGSVYYIALAVMILAVNGFKLYRNQE